MPRQNAITDVPGISVGQAEYEEALTGCTVVLCPRGAVAGLDQRGGAPGTRETDALNPVNLIQRVHAVVLAGGSAFGLDCVSGVMRYLRERKVGFRAGKVRVPIVPAAILFDLAIGSPDIFPDAKLGYQACLAATSAAPRQGNAGAGAGATVGKILGPHFATKAGIGTASMRMGKGVEIGAIVAVNAFGDVIDPDTGAILAGARRASAQARGRGALIQWADTINILKTGKHGTSAGRSHTTSTVIGVVATNAALTKPQAAKVAQMAQTGIARVIRPAHTMLDGDTLFALSTGNRRADINAVGACAAEVVTAAVLNAIRFAESAGGIPAIADLDEAG